MQHSLSNSDGIFVNPLPWGTGIILNRLHAQLDRIRHINRKSGFIRHQFSFCRYDYNMYLNTKVKVFHIFV